MKQLLKYQQINYLNSNTLFSVILSNAFVIHQDKYFRVL